MIDRSDLERILDSVSDSVTIHDRNFTIIAANRPARDMLGISEDDIGYIKCHMAFHGSDRPVDACHACRETGADGSTLEIDEPFLGRHLVLKTFLQRGDSEEKDAFVHIVSDVTRLKAAEQNLVESERKFRELADRLPEVVFETDARGMFTYVNRYAIETTGYTDEDIRHGLNCIETFVPEDRPRAVENFKKRMTGEDVGGVEYRMLKKDGSVLKVIVRADPIMKDGVPSGIRGVVIDVTRLKDIEDELKRHRDNLDRLVAERTRALEESERRFRSYVDNAPTGIFIANGEARYLEVNEAACRISGYSEGELLNMGIQDLVAAESLQSAMENFELLKSADKISNEFEIIRKEGTRGWWLVDAVRLSGDRFMGFTTDITEKKAAEKQNMIARNLESLGLLAGGIAHDFNNKLAAILNNISLAKLHLSPEHEAYRKLERIEGIYWQATKLANQLMTFSKGGSPHKEALRINEAIKETVEFVLSGSMVACVFEISDSPIIIEADSGQICQVISNIVLNAKDAMPSGGEITVRAGLADSGSVPSALGPGRFVRLEISDTGPGIAEENMGSIFDPFFSTKGEGRGLGLSTSYSIVKKHNGLIDAKSGDEGGTSFIIYLPASEASVADSPAGGNICMPVQGRKILVMDDDENFRETLSEMLRKIGHSVSQAPDGEGAIHKYLDELERGEPFDSVILDLTVPGAMGGVSTLEKLREVDPDVKAIVTSGYSNDPVISEYGKHGFLAALTKPFDMRSLIKGLESIH